jgi:simple sugar transport system permease protein
MREILGFTFEKRKRVSNLWQALMAIFAIIIAMLISSILILSAGADIREAFSALYAGAFGSWKAVIETLIKASPLILTGLAVSIAFRGKIWNIGAEGQLWAGAMAAYWVSANFTQLPRPLIFLSILAASFAAGAVWGFIPGFLKAKLKVDEVIVTVMLNYIIHFILSYLLSDPWRAPGEYYYITSPVPEVSEYPLLIQNTRLHAGFAVAIVAAVIVWWLMRMTRLGYEIRAIGLNPTASRFKSINVGRVIMVTMLISGGIAGLAGAGEVVGLHHRLRMDISTGYGFTGIIVAMLGGLNPLGVTIAAIFFGALENGSNRMQIFTGVPIALVYAMQAIVLLCLLAVQVLSNYRIRRVKDVQ